MKGFIVHFFGCADCAKNFQKEIQHLQTAVTSNDDAILYLWEVHNSVNERLHGDVTEDRAHPKQQFPTIAMCSECHVTNGGWNRYRVLDFLKKIYSYGGIKQDSRRLVTMKSKEPVVNPADENRVQNAVKDSDATLPVKNARQQQFRERFIMKSRKNSDAAHKSNSGAAVGFASNNGHVAIKNTTGSNIGFSSFDLCFSVAFYCVCSAFMLSVYIRIRGRCNSKHRYNSSTKLWKQNMV